MKDNNGNDTGISQSIKNIKCWSCGYEFDYLVEINPEDVFSVYCGICELENVIDLNPYRPQIDELYRSEQQPNQTVQSKRYVLPNSIQGQKPSETKS